MHPISKEVGCIFLYDSGKMSELLKNKSSTFAGDYNKMLVR